MAIQLLYRVVNRSGAVVGTYESKKVAAAVEARMETVHELSAKLAAVMPQATEAERDVVAEFLVAERENIASMLKGIKDLPAQEVPAAGSDNAAPAAAQEQPLAA